MVNYLLGALGIVVSVGLFLVGYRQTIGARKERMTSANTDLERVLLRRVVLEGFSPTRKEIDRLRDGKSREHRVAVSDILLPVELMNTVYTQIVENDFISPDLRKGIVERISPLFESLDKAEEQEPELAEKTSMSWFLTLMLGVLASALGALTSVLPQFRSIALGKKEALELVAITGGVSLVIIATYLLFNRLREEQEEGPPRASGIKAILEFERSIASAIRKTGLLVARAPLQSGYDFEVVTKTGDKVLVEAKAWTRAVPIVQVRHVVRRLGDLVAKESAKEALLVVREPLELPRDVVGDAPVRILSFREMRNYFAR